MKIPTVFYSLLFTCAGIVIAQTTETCPWDFRRGDKCNGVDNSVSATGLCNFNAQDGINNCRTSSKKKCALEVNDAMSNRTDYKDISGCKKDCQRFHRSCCCPAKTRSPTGAPSITPKPSSVKPTNSPTITCPWGNFKRSSSCSSYVTDKVGGASDCAFDARDDKIATSCAVVSKQQCDRFEYSLVKGCKNQCRMFHERCCCPVGGILDKPLKPSPIANKPIINDKDRPIVDGPFRSGD